MSKIELVLRKDSVHSLPAYIIAEQLKQAPEKPHNFFFSRLRLFIMPIVFHWKILALAQNSSQWNMENTISLAKLKSEVLYQINICYISWVIDTLQLSPFLLLVEKKNQLAV